MDASKKWATGFIIAVIIGVPVSCGIFGPSNKSSSQHSLNMPSAGDNAVFAQTNSNLFTATQQEFQQLTNFAQHNNQSAIQNMIDTGEASLVPVGTSVEVLNTGWDGSAQIQIMSGPLSGDEGYTFINALSKN